MIQKIHISKSKKRNKPIGVFSLKDPISETERQDFYEMWKKIGWAGTTCVALFDNDRMEFKGFVKLPRICSIPRACKKASKHVGLLSNYDYKSITGFFSTLEMFAYEEGRKHEEQVIIDWIQKWDGSTNSALGTLLCKKFKQLSESISKEINDLYEE